MTSALVERRSGRYGSAVGIPLPRAGRGVVGVGRTRDREDLLIAEVHVVGLTPVGATGLDQLLLGSLKAPAAIAFDQLLQLTPLFAILDLCGSTSWVS